MPDQYFCPDCDAASPIPGSCECGASYVKLDDDLDIASGEDASDDGKKYTPKDLGTSDDDEEIDIKLKDREEE